MEFIPVHLVIRGRLSSRVSDSRLGAGGGVKSASPDASTSTPRALSGVGEVRNVVWR